MSGPNWEEIERAMAAILELPDEQRGTYLAQQPAAIRNEVESLLAAYRRSGSFLGDETRKQAAGPDFLGRLEAMLAHAEAAARSARPVDAAASFLREGSTATDAGMTALAVEGRFPPGTVLAGRYRIVAPLGRGGMGEVYSATDLVLRQTVALKFLPESLGNDPRALNRLCAEVRLARQISHANICRVHDVAEAGDLSFLTMEYVDGEDLRSLLRRIGRVPVEKATEIARRLCAGLAAAHERKVLHRDLKPANIMIDAQGNVRIMDFGVAVLANERDTKAVGCGTPVYMAPEQLQGGEATVRTDIYSLGLVLWEVFGGQLPFEGRSVAELLRQKLTSRPRAHSLGIDVAPEVERAILRCIEPDPRDRPASATVIAVELSGGVALAAAIAAGETPEPELVAHAGAAEGMSVRVAVACLLTTVVSLVAFAFLAPRISVLSRIRIDTPDALERVARGTLSSLGINERLRHHVARFGYDTDALKRHFDPVALYFWYRASPSWMIPHDLTGVITIGNPPGELPGMVTTKWDGSGRLLYLKAVPAASGTTGKGVQDVWARLFTAAGLKPERFAPSEPGWIPAPGWDARASWIGAYPDAEGTRVRIEAAAWQGRPVYFEVAPDWPGGVGSPAVVTTQRISSGVMAVFTVLFAASVALAWRNVRSGRGDRRGAFRLAIFIFVGIFLEWVFKASHVPSLFEFTSLTAAIMWAGFLAAGFWTVYIALEPYVRRRWPHAIVSWTRILLLGRFRDSLVGGHILIGITFGAAIATLIAIVISLLGTYGPRLPSYWVLSGTRGTLVYLLVDAVDAVFNGLTMLFITFLCKEFFRKEWPAVLGVTAMAYVVEPPNVLTPAGSFVMIAPVVTVFVHLLLRRGLVTVIVACYTLIVLLSLPLTTDLSFPATEASIAVLCGFAALAFFGFHSTMAGRRLLKLNL